MDGRLQNEMLIDKRTAAKVAEMPPFVCGWYTNMKASRKTAATCRDYVNKVHNFLSSINTDVSKVTLSDINESTVTNYFLSIQTRECNGEMRYTSDSYQSTIWCCLDNFFNYLNRSGLIDQNYIRNINKPKNHDLDRINETRVMLTEKDFKKILKAINDEGNENLRARDRAIILLFMNTGMRKTALTSITLDDVDLEKHQLVIIDKGNKRHEYPLNDGVIDAINKWISVRDEYGNGTSDNHLFISSHGKVMHGNTVFNVIEKYTKKALGHPVSPHKLRSGYCSILYKKTGDIEFVRRCVGHANVATTQRYIVTKGEEKERAAEIMGSIL